MKRTPLIIGGIAGAALLWSGAWWAGKELYVAPRADAAVEQLRGGAAFFSFDQRTISGFPFGYDVAYENVAISDASTFWRWTTPLIRLETGIADAGEMKVTMSEVSVLVIEAPLLGGAADGSPMVFDIVSDGLIATLSGNETQNEAVIEAASMTLSQKEGASIVTGGKVILTGLSAEVETQPDAGIYLADVDADRLAVGYQYSPDGVNTSSNISEMTGVQIDIETRALSNGDLGAILANDGAAKVKFTASTYNGTGASSGGPSSPPVSVIHEGGKTTAELSIADGRALYAAKVQDADMKVDMQAPGPLSALAFTLGEMEMSMEMPLKQADEAQPYAIKLEMDDLKVDDSIWAAFDPLEKLDRSAMQLEIDITGGARVLTDFLGAQLSQSPIDLETLEIEDFELKALGAEAKAKGAFVIAGDASRSDGEMEMTVEGGLALLDNLAAAGLVPVEALGAYQALIAQFTVRDGDDDKLTTKIESRRGSVSINGRIISP